MLLIAQKGRWATFGTFLLRISLDPFLDVVPSASTRVGRGETPSTRKRLPRAYQTRLSRVVVFPAIVRSRRISQRSVSTGLWTAINRSIHDSDGSSDRVSSETRRPKRSRRAAAFVIRVVLMADVLSRDDHFRFERDPKTKRDRQTGDLHQGDNIRGDGIALDSNDVGVSHCHPGPPPHAVP